MKGKRYTTEEKIRMLRQADKGKTILEACRENNISEQTFHRWKREFGMIDVDQAKRMKELFEGERAVKTDAGGQDAGDRDPAGDPRKKTVSPGHKRQVAERLVARGQCSMRAGCRYFRLHRCTYAYKAKHPDAWLMKLKAAVRRLSRQYARWGYPKITKLLKDEGWEVGKRLVQRLRRELGLAIPPRKPRRRRRGVSTGLPTKAEYPGHVWTWDFIHDKTVRGGSLKMLTVLDEYTRECRVIHVDRHINAETVRGIMQKLLARHGPPQYIRSDNGSVPRSEATTCEAIH